jgi:hypothetical protein
MASSGFILRITGGWYLELKVAIYIFVIRLKGPAARFFEWDGKNGT